MNLDTQELRYPFMSADFALELVKNEFPYCKPNNVTPATFIDFISSGDYSTANAIFVGYFSRTMGNTIQFLAPDGTVIFQLEATSKAENRLICASRVVVGGGPIHDVSFFSFIGWRVQIDNASQLASIPLIPSGTPVDNKAPLHIQFEDGEKRVTLVEIATYPSLRWSINNVELTSVGSGSFALLNDTPSGSLNLVAKELTTDNIVVDTTLFNGSTYYPISKPIFNYVGANQIESTAGEIFNAPDYNYNITWNIQPSIGVTVAGGVASVNPTLYTGKLLVDVTLETPFVLESVVTIELPYPQPE